jgi:hypothetical protein
MRAACGRPGARGKTRTTTPHVPTDRAAVNPCAHTSGSRGNRRFQASVSDLAVGSGRELARGATFVIHGVRRVVWCKITVPPKLDPAQGAAAGEELGAFLLDHVLARHSEWLGVVLDVRDGPSVLGPISLRVMERILERAELVRRRVAILMAPRRPLLEEQLSGLVTQLAPHFATLTQDQRISLDWMTAAG